MSHKNIDYVLQPIFTMNMHAIVTLIHALPLLFIWSKRIEKNVKCTEKELYVIMYFCPNVLQIIMLTHTL